MGNLICSKCSAPYLMYNSNEIPRYCLYCGEKFESPITKKVPLKYQCSTCGYEANDEEKKISADHLRYCEKCGRHL